MFTFINFTLIELIYPHLSNLDFFNVKRVNSNFLTVDILEELEYDFIITNFTLPPIELKNNVLNESIPISQNQLKIQVKLIESVRIES